MEGLSFIGKAEGGEHALALVESEMGTSGRGAALTAGGAVAGGAARDAARPTTAATAYAHFLLCIDGSLGRARIARKILGRTVFSVTMRDRAGMARERGPFAWDV